MTEQINGHLYYHFIDYGIRNLSRYREHVNGLNVFPVPDGDTGTNMIKTLQNGLGAMEGQPASLSLLSRRFARAVVFGARGNSGVILSQFFRGFSEPFFEREEADVVCVADALEQGVKAAYAAVSHPVEGTMLTVLRDAADRVRLLTEKGEITSIDVLLDVFLDRAKQTLAHTPEQLPVLKEAGVVDSGGAGVIYVFSGMKKYLCGEPLASPVEETPGKAIDYSRFDRASAFSFGYCTELLLQLTDGKRSMDQRLFAEELNAMGDSMVIADEGDKIKLHIHTREPERILSYCHEYGEFLSLKIENMSVQHHEFPRIAQVAKENRCEYFSVVAVAHDPAMGRRFEEMGADAVIIGDGREPPSAAEFCEAFRRTGASRILIFPNGKNAQFAAHQGGTLYGKAEVTVFDTVSDAQCYGAMPMIDFEESNVDTVVRELCEIVENMRVVTISAAEKDTVYEGRQIQTGELVAMSQNHLLAVGAKPGDMAVDVICLVLSREPREVITVFAGSSVTARDKKQIKSFLQKAYPHVDSAMVETEDSFYPLTISFE